MPEQGPNGRDVQNSKAGLSLESALWNWMTGSLIGLAGAALLLIARPGAAGILFAGTSVWSSKLPFLILAALCCGSGAIVTGVIFFLVER